VVMQAVMILIQEIEMILLRSNVLLKTFYNKNRNSFGRYSGYERHGGKSGHEKFSKDKK